MADLINVIEINPHDKIAYTDKECLLAITKAMKIFKKNLNFDEQKVEIGRLCSKLTKLTNKDYNNKDVREK